MQVRPAINVEDLYWPRDVDWIWKKEGLAITESPTLEEWKALYEAAVAFRKLAPWDWMYDDDLFAVVNPETGVTGYCVVMGALGEFSGLGSTGAKPDGGRCKPCGTRKAGKRRSTHSTH